MPADLRHTTAPELRQMSASLKGRAEALMAEARTITGTATSPRRISAGEGSAARALAADAAALVDQRKAVTERLAHLEKSEAERAARVASWPLLDTDNPGATMTTATATPVGGKSPDSRWSSEALAQMAKADPGGRLAKSLASAGSVLVPTAFDTTVIRDGERPQLVRQLLPSQVISGTDRFGFMRQVVRENNATAVAKGQLKPTSRYKVERVEDRARVIAHLSEPIDRVDLEDAADLASFLDSEMRGGVLSAGEDQIINGDGQGENLTGILATEGVLVQPYSVDPLTTLRKALTSQQGLGNVPTAWVLSPSDWEALELTRENGATGPFMLASGPVDRAAQRLWGLSVVVSPAMATGRAVLGDWAGSARVYQREDVQISWSDGVFLPDGAGGGSTAFVRNQLIMRAEERLGFALTRPSAFVDVDLSA